MNKKIHIGDLIEVPAIETVIQLEMADSQDEKHARDLLSNFVITDEIENAFRQIFRHIQDKQGFGAFLKGNYGSGKSHFLAVLFLLLENPNLWKYISHPLFQTFLDIREQKILSIKIALHNFSAEESLEAILFGEIENTISDKIDQPLLLRNSTLLVEHFNKYILPQHPEFLKQVGKAGEDWQAACRQNPEEAAAKVYSFVRERNLPLKPVFDRREALHALQQTLAESRYDGVFIALDELSEYLKAKPDPVSFNEDLRFLQFMGEACQGGVAGQLPIYLIASLQENIEKTGYMEKDLMYRIKDRFPLRFYLSAHHVNQLISQRLTSKKEDSETVIGDVYRKFSNAFPNMEISPEAFFNIYPVHPDTVTLLEGLTPIFSQHRGVVDFIYHQLTGDEKRHWKGMLHLPADCLVTPDTIFDHFQERIREIPEMNPFVDVVYRTLEREVPHLFEAEKDRQIALKAIKIMILVEISPIEKRKTVKQLAEMINEPVSDLEQSLNYQYLEEVILQTLTREASFVGSAKNEVGESVYFVSLEMTIHQMLRNRIQEILKQAPPLEKVISGILQNVQSDQIPLASIAAARRKKYSFPWQNTRREGWIIFKAHSNLEPIEIDEYLRDLEESERDFVLIIFSPTSEPFPDTAPLQKHLREHPFAPAVVGWHPRPLTEEDTQFLFLYHAHQFLKDQLFQPSTPQEKQLLQLVQEWLTENRTALTNLMEDLYLGGRLEDFEGWRDDRFAPFYADFKAILKQIFSPALQKIFPAHSRIMPGDVLVPFAVDKLFLQFIKPGSLSRPEAHAQHIDNLISLYLEPLKIVQLENDRYFLNLDATHNPLLSEILNRCASQEAVNLYSLYWQLRKGKWGLSREMFVLLIGALLASGKLMALASGNVVSFHSIQQITDGSIDAVGLGKIIGEEIWNAFQPFLKLEEFKDVAPAYTESTQELFWRRLKSLRDNLNSLLNEWRELNRRYENYPAFEPFKKAIAPDIPLLQEFLQSFRTSYSAWKGLEFLAYTLGLDKLRQTADTIIRFRQRIEVLKNHFMELNSIYTYLQHPVLETLSGQENFRFVKDVRKIYRALETGEVLEKNILPEIKRRFYEFKRQFVEKYTAAHQEYYQNEVFQSITHIEQHPAVQILRKFHEIENIAPEPDWIVVQQKIASIPRPCDRILQKQLAISPVCQCGFVPGRSLPANAQKEIVEMAMAGVQSALKQLQERFRWMLEEYAGKLAEIGKENLSAEILQLLNISIEKLNEQFPQLLRLLHSEVTAAINEAIRGKILILYRRISDLEQKILGRQMTVRELRNILEEWIAGNDTLTDNTYIRVLGAGKDLKLNRQDYQPISESIPEEGNRFFEAFWLLAWAQQHNREDWLQQIRAQYRIKEFNSHLFSTVMEQRLLAGDADAMQIYLDQAGKIPLLESMLKMDKLSSEALTSFILKERLWKRLSEKATRLLIQKIAPTEPLSDLEANLLLQLPKHPRWKEWAHLRLFHSYIKCLHLVQDSTQSHPIEFYLTGGWQLLPTFSQFKSLNQTLDIVADHRSQSLEKIIAETIQQWTFPIQGTFKSRLNIPYFKINAFPQSLKSILQKLKGNLILILMDAMRWDVWEELNPFFQKALQHRLIYRGAMEVESPTTTEVNRQILIEQVLNTRAVINWEIERVSQNVFKQHEVEKKMFSPVPLLVLNFTIIDELLHESQDPFYTFLDIIKLRMDGLVKPLLQKIPKSKHLIITSDHGFTGFPGNYTHGGDSFLEKIVPFSVWEGIEK